MPSIHRSGAWTAHVYNFDHPPPHFHVRCNKHRVKLRLGTLEVLAGYIPPKELKEVVLWAAGSESYLELCWNAAEAGEELP